METVAQPSQQQTILAHIDSWDLTRCPESCCEELIHALWLHGEWTPENTYRCPRHAFASAHTHPPEERDAILDGIRRVMRMESLLYLTDLPRLAALRVGDAIPPLPATLYGWRERM